MNHDETLPTLATYKPNCQDCSANWLAYQTTLNDIRLVEFHPNNTIKQIFAINIGSEPLKALRLEFSREAGVPYLALTFHTRYAIFKKN